MKIPNQKSIDNIKLEKRCVTSDSGKPLKRMKTLEPVSELNWTRTQLVNIITINAQPRLNVTRKQILFTNGQ